MSTHQIKKARVKRPIDAFSRCVCCGNSHLQHIDIDVYCNLCGWNSLEAYVDAGGLDSIDGYL